MRISGVFLILTLKLLSLGNAAPGSAWKGKKLVSRGQQHGQHYDATRRLCPKLFLITHYDEEGQAWLNQTSLDLYAQNITVPGLSPLFPEIHCSSDGDLCLLTTGEGEINAAATLMALSFSPILDLVKTYFMISGNGGINPLCGGIGSVAFARFAVQVALQHEIDPRELPANYTTGYIPQGSRSAMQYPQYIYGTEVFELNENLRNRALSLASKANLSDSQVAADYRALYPATQPGSKPPVVFAGDTATSDNWFSGNLLREAFTNFTTLVTNGTGTYCLTAQEDNGTLEALLRADVAGRVDYSRVLVMRVGSDYDSPPPGVSAQQNLLYVNPGGFELSFKNMVAAGSEVIKDIRARWTSEYQHGLRAENYIGDIYNSLQGPFAPDFGLPAEYIPST